MKRTMTVLLLMFALTGCRLFEQSRHAAANAFAAAVVRNLLALQSSAPAGPSSRPLDRPYARLAIPSPRPAAAAVVVTASPVAVTAPAAARVLSAAPRARVCSLRIKIHLDENGNASL
jgi:hypothetical protein